MLQLLHENYEDPLTSLMPHILNTLHYVATVLEEWGVTAVCIESFIYNYAKEIIEIITITKFCLCSIFYNCNSSRSNLKLWKMPLTGAVTLVRALEK